MLVHVWVNTALIRLSRARERIKEECQAPWATMYVMEAAMPFRETDPFFMKGASRLEMHPV